MVEVLIYPLPLNFVEMCPLLRRRRWVVKATPEKRPSVSGQVSVQRAWCCGYVAVILSSKPRAQAPMGEPGWLASRPNIM